MPEYTKHRKLLQLQLQLRIINNVIYQIMEYNPVSS